MDELDQTARYALKMAPAESLHWLVPDLDPDLGKVLEGFDVWQSQTYREVERRGRLAGQRDALLQILRRRFKGEPPQELAQLIQQTTDLETLSRWTDYALEVSSLEEFRSRIQPPTPPAPNN